ncbi:hypothetical protein MSAN_01235400 [Mycena sanguinolenta]|uniref:Uncharacterized protein n=1 Tax=Mycena sanguinolenta TaxID=230812 RepID=A0A8H6YD92_9AGAR|nr:hypothetical protein MSAN_01235400 [Mycena sanguinolenta]
MKYSQLPDAPLPYDPPTPSLRMANLHELECHSIHSWWSDSNSLGATIPLHTFAKPLAKFLHHRQVTALLAKNRNSHLSAELLDLLTIYLESKEISAATKTLILRDLEIRAATEDDANAIVKNGFPALVFLLSSSDPNILGIVCNVFGTLAVWTYLDAEGLSSYPFEMMVHLSMHENPSVRRHSLNVLNRLITLSELAAQAVVHAGIINIATKLLLHSEDRDISEQACDVLNNLARYDSLKVTLAGSIPNYLLIALVEYDHPQS